MPKIIIIVAVAVLLGLAACAGIRAPQVRGIGQAVAGAGVNSNGVLASNALPAMAVAPASDLRLVAHGVTDAGVSMQGAAMGSTGARVWYALNADNAGGRQLAASLAELDNPWEWSLNPNFTERRGLPLLREAELPRCGVTLTALTYIRPGRKDPWMPAFQAAGKGWEGDVLLRQYTWWSVANRVKVMVEYREPVPRDGLPLEDDRAALRAFEDRADAAFQLLRQEQGDAIPADIIRDRRNNANISPRLLADVLGEAVPGVAVRCDDL